MFCDEGLSFRTGPSEPPLYGGTIPEHFAQIVSQHGDRPAVIARHPTSSASGFSETTLTYHMLDLLSNRLASSLAGLGVNKGDRVAISLGNSAEFAALTYACFKLGAVLVPLNPAFNAHQVVAALEHLGVGVLVMGAVTDLAYKPGRGRSNEHLLSQVVGDLRAGEGGGGASRGDPTIIQSEQVPMLKRVIVVDNRLGHQDVRFNPEQCRALISYRSLLHGSEQRQQHQRLDAHDTINIQFTSGTTSAPKAAMLTHHSILNNGILIADRMGLDPSDRIVVPPPLFHCFGSILGYMATATTGAAILFPSPAFDPRASLEMCVDHDATGLYGVSTMLIAILDALDGDDGKQTGNNRGAPTHLRKGIVAGSSIPESLMKRIYQRLGLRDLVICYGMTETSPVSCMTSPAHPFHERCSTVGTPLPHTSIKIVDPADRSVVLPLDTPGELAAGGYLVMRGYYGDEPNTSKVRVVEEATRVSASRGNNNHDNKNNDSRNSKHLDTHDQITWLYSGDEAKMDQNGFVTITGRIKDIIIRAGENIHPLEIENTLFRHDGIAQASVVAVSDARLGEAVAAFIIPKTGWTTGPGPGPGASAGGSASGQGEQAALTPESVRDWVRTHLSSHLVPKHVFWVQDFPKTSSGKIQKFRLRERAERFLAGGVDSRAC
ncbi:hypothetical protein E4U21_005807 [Claviceps maximensis]|nr:hypothetical protein E4U21_005807 [Claviceps maximensis]